MLFKWFSRLYHAIVFIIFLGIFVYLFAPILVEAKPISNAFINEIHYDNIGLDVNEFIEIAGDGSIDLLGWSLHLYNGSNGEEYKSFSLHSWLYIEPISGFGILPIKVTGLQNGSPDGVVLFDGLNIIQFLSYEGVFTATSGIAEGVVSTDIGVFQGPTTSVGDSLQLTGHGRLYSDFIWGESQPSSFGAANVRQSFVGNNLNLTPVNEPSSFLLFLFILLRLFKKNI